MSKWWWGSSLGRTGGLRVGVGGHKEHTGGLVGGVGGHMGVLKV